MGDTFGTRLLPGMTSFVARTSCLDGRDLAPFNLQVATSDPGLSKSCASEQRTVIKVDYVGSKGGAVFVNNERKLAIMRLGLHLFTAHRVTRPKRTAF